jgi:hypothetical protein
VAGAAGTVKIGPENTLKTMKTRNWLAASRTVKTVVAGDQETAQKNNAPYGDLSSISSAPSLRVANGKRALSYAFLLAVAILPLLSCVASDWAEHDRSQNEQRAAYWREKGYDFNPEYMTAWAMDAAVEEGQHRQNSAVALDSTKHDSSELTEPPSSVSKPSPRIRRFVPPVGKPFVAGNCSGRFR